MSKPEDLVEAIRSGSEQRSGPDIDADESEVAAQIKNNSEGTRRKLLVKFSVMAILARVRDGLVGGLVGGVAWDSLKFIAKIAQTRLISDLSIRPEFIYIANRNRHRNDLRTILEDSIPGNLSPVEECCVRALRALNQGDVVHPDDYVLLDSAANEYIQGDTAAFVRTLLAAHLVRIGADGEASELINPIEIKRLSENFRLILIEQKLSTNYVATRSTDALNVQHWNFSEALRELNPYSEELGFKVDLKGSLNPRVTFPERISANGISSAIRRSVRGFYLIFFPMLYSAANSKISNTLNVGELIYYTLKDFSPHFQRQVWNGAFIAALQFHRQGAFVQRDRLLRICLRDPNFWGPIAPEDRFGTALKGTEIIPIMAAHFMRSTPHLLRNFDDLHAESQVPTTSQILSLAQTMSPSSALQSIDMIRKISRNEISPALMILRHGIHPCASSPRAHASRPLRLPVPTSVTPPAISRVRRRPRPASPRSGRHHTKPRPDLNGRRKALARRDHLRWRDPHALLAAASPATRRIEPGRDGQELPPTFGADQRAALEGINDVRHLGEDQSRRPQRLSGPWEYQRPPGVGDAARIAREGGGDLPAQLRLHLLGLGADGGHGRPLASAHLVRQYLPQIADDARAEPHRYGPPSLRFSTRSSRSCRAA